jgi:hypothetical protein
MRPSRTYLERINQDPTVNPEKDDPTMSMPKPIHNSLGAIASELSRIHGALEDLMNKNDSLEGTALEDALSDIDNAVDHVNRVLEDEA